NHLHLTSFPTRRSSDLLPGTRIVDCFSPVPMWARRRWDAVGEPVASSGCLFSYKFTEREISEELAFARDRLWLTPDDAVPLRQGDRKSTRLNSSHGSIS